MSRRVAVVADVFERKSHIAIALRQLGADVYERRLAVGDYAFGGVLVERKTVYDLHVSIIKGRFWPQIGRMLALRRHPYLVIEGDDLDRGPLRPEGVRGACLATLDLGVGLLQTKDPADSARWIYLLARRTALGRNSRRDRPAYAQRPKPRSERLAAEAMLSSVPGISTVAARALLERFGSVAGVVSATQDEWLSVPGVGPFRAKALARTLAHEFAYA